MFLIVRLPILLMATLIAFGAGAESRVEGLHLKNFKLDSFSLKRGGMKMRAGEASTGLCDARVRPAITETGGQIHVSLNASLGFEWRNMQSPVERQGDCVYGGSQEIRRENGGSVLVQMNTEECETDPDPESERATLTLAGDTITYQVEPIAKIKGEWRALANKEGYTCTWKAN